MRALPVLCVLALSVLPACSSGEEAAQPAASRSVAGAAPSSAAAPTAPSDDESPPAIEGLDLLAEDPSHDHVDGPLEYDTVPPVGGPHNPRWLACDVYAEPVPAEFAVHSLEHGAVWIAHDPDLPADQVDVLAELASRNEEYVLVSPQEGLDSRVVAAIWGGSLEASSADDPRLAQLVEAYAGGAQGGEPGVPCRQQGVTPREARGLLGS